MKYEVICKSCNSSPKILSMDGLLVTEKDVKKEIKNYGYCIAYCDRNCHSYQLVIIKERSQNNASITNNERHKTSR